MAQNSSQSSADGLMDVFDDFLKFLDDEFWLIFFAIVYAFSLIFFGLAVLNVRQISLAPHSLLLPLSVHESRDHTHMFP